MKKKIMLAEDDVVLRILFGEELQDEGYEVLTAGNGKEAIQRFEEGKPDLVILDIVMPVMDGIEAMNLLKERNGKVPIILHSSYSEYQMDPRIKGAAAFVIKSSDLTELKRKIREIFLLSSDRGDRPES